MRNARSTRCLLAVSTLLLTACGGSETTEQDRRGDALAVPGPWEIPATTLAIGDTQYVEYTGAGAWPGQCAGDITPGGQIVREYLLATFPQIRSIGGYSCRAIVGAPDRMSVHGTGRALDVMLPLDGEEADNGLGDPIGNFLIENAEAIGIQYIIWDLWTWNASRSPGSKDRAYGGSHPHHDHLHVELSVEASQNTIPWFDATVQAPGVDGCALITPFGRTIDELDPCFQIFGPDQYWRSESGVGHGGSLLWTNAFENPDPSNWARWNLDFEAGGEFVVAVYLDPAFAVHTETRYEVRHSGQQTVVTIDQSVGNGWTDLGSFAFAAGDDQWAAVYDDMPGPVADDQHIAVDALRVLPVAPPPPPMMTPPPTDEPAVDDPNPDELPPPDPNRPEPPSTTPFPTDPAGDGETKADAFRRPKHGGGGCTVAFGIAEGDGSSVVGLGLLAWALRRRRRRSRVD